MKRILRSVAYNWREGGPRQIAARAVSRIRRTAIREYEAVVYRLTELNVTPPDPGEDAELKELDMAALLAGKYFKTVAFPDLTAERFQKGERCVGIYFGGHLGHVSWMTLDRLQIDLGIPQVPVPGGVAVYDMFTLPAYRGRGAQTNALRALCRLAHDADRDRAVALVREGNAASRHVFRKCGFEEIGTLRYHRRLWRERLDHPPL